MGIPEAAAEPPDVARARAADDAASLVAVEAMVANDKAEAEAAAGGGGHRAAVVERLPPPPYPRGCYDRDSDDEEYEETRQDGAGGGGGGGGGGFFARGPQIHDSQIIKRMHQILNIADFEDITMSSLRKQLEVDLNITLSDRKQFVRDEVSARQDKTPSIGRRSASNPGQLLCFVIPLQFNAFCFVMMS
jgi:hypothetical protein